MVSKIPPTSPQQSYSDRATKGARKAFEGVCECRPDSTESLITDNHRETFHFPPVYSECPNIERAATQNQSLLNLDKDNQVSGGDLGFHEGDFDSP